MLLVNSAMISETSDRAAKGGVPKVTLRLWAGNRRSYGPLGR